MSVERAASEPPVFDPRSRRKRGVRKVTLSATRGVSVKELRAGAAEYPEAVEGRPVTRGDCVGGERPCPFAGCRFHLYLDVARNGSLTLNFPDLEPDELQQTCALDVADEGAHRLETIGDLMNLTRERTRQVEARALSRLALPSVKQLHAEAP